MEKQANRSALLKLKKAQLINELLLLQEQHVATTLKEAATKKELLLTKEQLESANIALRDVKQESMRRLEKINSLEIFNTKLTQTANEQNTAATRAQQKLEKLTESHRITKFFMWLFLCMIIALIIIIVSRLDYYLAGLIGNY